MLFGRLFLQNGKIKTGMDFYANGMMELNDEVGQIIKKLDGLSIADNTIAVLPAILS